MPGSDVRIAQLATPESVSPGLRDSLTGCWVAVTNAGGAAGFPFPPVDAAQVAPVAAALIRDLDPDRSLLVTAMDGATLLGWVNLYREPNRWSLIGARSGICRHIHGTESVASGRR